MIDKEVQGLELYSYDDIIDIVRNFVIDRIYDNGYSEEAIIVKDIKLHGSRLRGQARDDSDLDAVVEYEGDIREDDLFTMLNNGDPLYIDSIKVDINPIKENMSFYMRRSDMYDSDKMKRLENKSRKLQLEKRIARLENMYLKNRKQTNEASPVMAKVIPVVLNNLPAILKMLPEFIEALKSDQVNDNKDKIEVLTKFGELGERVGEMFSEMNK